MSESNEDTIDYDEKALQIARAICGSKDAPLDLVRSVRSQLPHSPTPGFLYAKQVAELVEIMRADLPRDEKRNRTRAIGALIASVGGVCAMVEAEKELRWQFPQGEGGEDGWHPALIDAYWNGISGWRW